VLCAVAVKAQESHTLKLSRDHITISGFIIRGDFDLLRTRPCRVNNRGFLASERSKDVEVFDLPGRKKRFKVQSVSAEPLTMAVSRAPNALSAPTAAIPLPVELVDVNPLSISIALLSWSVGDPGDYSPPGTHKYFVMWSNGGGPD